MRGEGRCLIICWLGGSSPRLSFSDVVLVGMCIIVALVLNIYM